jgi:molybdenum cofactor synthesis domain-containing protein
MAFRVFVLTASDAGSRGEREDRSGPVIEEMVTAAGYEVVGRALLPDDRAALAEKMAAVCDGDLADLLLTTGGTGFSPRDVTPEATAAVLERETPFFPQAMLYYSLNITPNAMLSRMKAGIRGRSLILNLPGSPKAATENLAAVIDTLPHALKMLHGEGH